MAMSQLYFILINSCYYNHCFFSHQEEPDVDYSKIMPSADQVAEPRGNSNVCQMLCSLVILHSSVLIDLYYVTLVVPYSTSTLKLNYCPETGSCTLIMMQCYLRVMV